MKRATRQAAIPKEPLASQAQPAKAARPAPASRATEAQLLFSDGSRMSASGSDVLGRDGSGTRPGIHQMLKTVEARLVADEVATQILGLMTRGVLQPNDKLPTEVALAQSLGVGRSTVREAKGQLAAKGFLTTRGKSGTYVSTPSANPLDVEAVVALVSDASAEQLHEARSIVEIAAIQLAAKRFEAKDIDELRQATHPIDGEVWFNHVDVHRAIVAASHNTILLALYDLLSHPIRVKLSAFYEAVADPRAELSAHSNLVEAIQSGDPGTAANAMSEHLHGSDIKRHDALNAFLQSRGS